MPPVPKPASRRQRRNRTATAATLQAPPVRRVELPAKDPAWHHLTVAWWATIWASPMADEWVDADVPGLVALARLVDDFWAGDGSDAARLAAEIRMQQREYGLSPLSRRQLQWEIKRLQAKPEPADEPAAPPRSGKAVLSVLAGGAT